jgi:NAD(P)-dependent dehydrogenase (short-subunit alcohol dehydrogenase family)
MVAATLRTEGSVLLEGRVALVAGAGPGLGREIALSLAGQGADVVVGSDRAERVAAVADEIRGLGRRAEALPLDPGDAESCASVLKACRETFGGLDVLVANAVRWPIDAAEPLGTLDAAVWDQALRANLEGTAATVRAALPHLREAESGRIVLVSSGVSRHGFAGATAYATAKAGLDGLVAALKWEAGVDGILVNIVSPGFTVTDNNLAHFPDEVRESVRVRTPSTRLSVPTDVASAVLWFGSPINGNVTGVYIPVAGGID